MKATSSILLALWLASLRGTTIADAQPRPSVRLRYRPASDCPAEEVIRRGVVARLGYDPFKDDAKLGIEATIEASPDALRARVQMQDAAGNLLGEQELTSAPGDCAELSEAIEFAVAVAIDPVRMGMGAPPIVKVREPARAPSAPPASRSALGYVAGVGALGAFGSSPGATVGLTAQGGLRWKWLSFALELRGDIPASTAVGYGSIRSWLLLASTLSCAHHRFLAGCAIMGGGMLRGIGQDIDQASRATLPLVVAGGRIGLDFRLPGKLLLRFHGDLLVPLVRPSLQVNNREVWATSPVAGALGSQLARSW